MQLIITSFVYTHFGNSRYVVDKPSEFLIVGRKHIMYPYWKDIWLGINL